MESMLFMIVIIAVMIAMMWVGSRKNKQQQKSIQEFRESLKAGDEVATNTGLLGKIVSVDQEKEQVIIDSEGSLSRWRIQVITKPPIVPAYVHDDEVDENGNPLQEIEKSSDQDDQPDSDKSNKEDDQKANPSTDEHKDTEETKEESTKADQE